MGPELYKVGVLLLKCCGPWFLVFLGIRIVRGLVEKYHKLR